MKLNTVDIKESDPAIHDWIRKGQTDTLIITKDGNPYAALVPLSDLDWESVSLSLNPQFMSIIEGSRQRLKKEGGIPLEEIETRFAEEEAAKSKSRKRAAS